MGVTMDFVGTGNRLTAADYVDDAAQLKVPVATILGVVEVEAAGSGWDSRKRPKILFEPHILWRELGPGAKRDQAAALGLAYAKWGSQPYPATSDAQYARVAAAVAIDQEAALRSTSWGLTQIMGFHREELGYSSALALVQDAMLGENEQLAQFTLLITTWGLQGKLQQRDAAGFARAYNGAGYATNHYDTKLLAAWSKYDALARRTPERGDETAGVPLAVRQPALATWMHLQTSLNMLELADPPLGVDGDPGPKTLAAARGLVPKIQAAGRA